MLAYLIHIYTFEIFSEQLLTKMSKTYRLGHWVTADLTTILISKYVRRMRSAAEITHRSLLALHDLFETDPESKHAFCNHVYSKSWHRSIQSQTAEMC